MKIKQFNVITGDIEIIPRGDRWYGCPNRVCTHLYLTDGTRIVMESKPGFMFDGRSGGPLVDFITPNLGDQRHLACWWMHDIHAYALYLSFRETNDVLYQTLRLAGDSWFQASLIESGVSISDSWFGEPLPTSREFPNLQLISVRHYAS